MEAHVDPFQGKQFRVRAESRVYSEDREVAEGRRSCLQVIDFLNRSNDTLSILLARQLVDRRRFLRCTPFFGEVEQPGIKVKAPAAAILRTRFFIIDQFLLRTILRMHANAHLLTLWRKCLTTRQDRVVAINQQLQATL